VAIAVAGANSDASAISLVQGPLNDQIGQLRGRTLSFSARLKASAAGCTAKFAWYDGVAGGGTWQIQSAFTIGTTYSTLTGSFLVAATSNQLYIGIYFESAATFYVDNAMLVVGSVAADYAPLHPADDLARCLRYFQYIGASGAGDIIVSGIASAGGQTIYTTLVCAEKAVSPTVTILGTWNVSNSGQPAVAASSVRAVRVSAAALAAGQFYTFNGTAGNYIQLEANP
jgi:hypothetical protein